MGLLLPRQLAGETASADHALRILPGPVPELAVRRDEPVRRVGRCLTGDPVVGDLAAGADDVVRLDRRAPVEDDQRPQVVLVRPVADELDEPFGADVRPERALDVAPVDDQGRGDRVKLTEPQYRAFGPAL
jgi:hypothetical protein